MNKGAISTPCKAISAVPPSLANQFRAARKSHGFSQDLVSRATGIARTTLTALENGDAQIKLMKFYRMPLPSAAPSPDDLQRAAGEAFDAVIAHSRAEAAAMRQWRKLAAARTAQTMSAVAFNLSVGAVAAMCIVGAVWGVIHA